MAVSVKLCAKIDQRLRALARQMNCSNHWLMVEAIRRFVECEEARLRGLYSPEHMKAVQRILQFNLADFEPYRQLPARQWYGRGGE